MISVKDLKDQEFLGKVINKGGSYYVDPKKQGRYRIHIPKVNWGF